MEGRYRKIRVKYCKSKICDNQEEIRMNNDQSGNRQNNGTLDNRKLTKAELKRKEEFDLLCKNLKNEGYEQHNLTMSAFFGNAIALVIGLPILIPMIAAYFAVNDGFDISFGYTELLLFAAGVIAFTVGHELIHGMTWGAFAKSHWKAISFGFIVQYMTPYCSCKDPLKKYQIILGALMPTIVLGIIPGIITVFTGNMGVWLMAMFMIVCGGGDMACVVKALAYRSKKKDKLYIDHPYELGIVAFER